LILEARVLAGEGKGGRKERRGREREGMDARCP